MPAQEWVDLMYYASIETAGPAPALPHLHGTTYKFYAHGGGDAAAGVPIHDVHAFLCVTNASN